MSGKRALTNAADTPPAHRPLVSRTGVLVLSVGALAVFVALMPLAQHRQVLATVLAPSALSLRFLQLGVDQRPNDPALRLELARKFLQSGLYEQARQNARLLCARSDAVGQEARFLVVDIDHASFIAIDPNQTKERAAALTRLLSSMSAIDVSGLDVSRAEQFAARYRELEQPGKAAELLDHLARRLLPDAERRVALADAAWVEAELPLLAAKLQAWFAEQAGPNGLEHARLAIERTRRSGDADATRALFEQMHARYPEDASLFELEAQVAEETDVRCAYELMLSLTKKHPAEVKYHRETARLAEATGQSLRALDEYVWLVRHGGSAQDRQRAVALARANWDMPLLRELLDGRNSRHLSR
jgi:hypothetical protein